MLTDSLFNNPFQKFFQGSLLGLVFAPLSDQPFSPLWEHRDRAAFVPSQSQFPPTAPVDLECRAYAASEGRVNTEGQNEAALGTRVN